MMKRAEGVSWTIDQISAGTITHRDRGDRVYRQVDDVTYDIGTDSYRLVQIVWKQRYLKGVTEPRSSRTIVLKTRQAVPEMEGLSTTLPKFALPLRLQLQRPNSKLRPGWNVDSLRSP